MNLHFQFLTMIPPNIQPQCLFLDIGLIYHIFVILPFCKYLLGTHFIFSFGISQVSY